MASMVALARQRPAAAQPHSVLLPASNTPRALLTGWVLHVIQLVNNSFTTAVVIVIVILIVTILITTIILQIIVVLLAVKTGLAAC